jgi:arylsulfatase A-like enzyme
MRSNVLLNLIVVASLSTGLACDAPTPFGRLVDPSDREGAVSLPDSLLVLAPDSPAKRLRGASTLPTATIDHDTRPVLATHARQTLATRIGVAMTEPDVAHYRRSVAGLFPEAENLLVNLRVFIFGTRDWQTLPPVLRPIEELGDDRMLDLELDLEGVAEGTTVHLWADAYQAPPIGGTSYQSVPHLIPQGSRIEFAFGVLEAALLQGPVRFDLSACEEDGCVPIFSEVYDPELKDRSGWQDRSVSLSAVWGEVRSLKFDATPIRPEAMSLPVWANPSVVTVPEAMGRPNVILLSIDTLRRDSLSAYGYERETSPFIDQHLAANGAVFENFISEAATTEVSHMSLFTSLPALVHGVTDFDRKLAVPVMPLAEAFRESGYDTAAFTEGGPMIQRLGFNIGFDRWRENPNIHFLFPGGQVERVFGQGWDWLSRRRDRPFFLFLHTFQVHHPLSPPLEYLEYFIDDDVELSEEALDKARYDQEIRYVDDQLAKLWTQLENRGLAKNTILVLLSDHGDEFWEHGERGHGNLPYEEVLSVPLIMIGPTIAKGLRSQRPLHHIDLMPTLLDLAGIPIPEHALGTNFGDVARGLNVEVDSTAGPRIRTSAAWAIPDEFQPPAFAIRRENFKVIRYEKGRATLFKCFELEQDPAEEKNLCRMGPNEEALELSLSLDAYQSAMEALRTSLAGEIPDDAEIEKVPLPPEVEAQLRALGYIQ